MFLIFSSLLIMMLSKVCFALHIRELIKLFLLSSLSYHRNRSKTLPSLRIALAVLLHKKIVLLSFLGAALYKFNTLLGKTWGENINWDV